MWTCLYLSHIVVIIMIIIAILGIVYGISQKKIKVYQVIIIFLFCVISMALVTGVTSMQYINSENDEIRELEGDTKTNYWTYDEEAMSRIETPSLEYTKLVDLETGNLVAIKEKVVETGKEIVDLSNKEKADEVCKAIDIKEELELSENYLVTLNSKEFIKANEDIYYVTYNYTYTDENLKEEGKIYYIVNEDNQMKTMVMTNINNESKEVEFEGRVLEIINTMKF